MRLLSQYHVQSLCSQTALCCFIKQNDSSNQEQNRDNRLLSKTTIKCTLQNNVIPNEIKRTN